MFPSFGEGIDKVHIDEGLDVLGGQRADVAGNVLVSLDDIDTFEITSPQQ